MKLDGLTTLQRKLLTDLMRKRHPHFWSHFESHVYDWEAAKKNFELFLQNHSSEFLRELKKSGFNGYESNVLLEETKP
ncbi:MAG: hypothetical protein QXX51_08435 [Candidatus Bathyarchaeia archaeon]